MRDPNEIINGPMLLRALSGFIAIVALLGAVSIGLDALAGEPVGWVRGALVLASLNGVYLFARYALTGRFGITRAAPPPAQPERNAP